jgi:hypothetical protein
MQFYDPHRLIDEVQDLLADHGLTAEITDATAAQVGASSLLRGLGFMPAIDAVDAYPQILAAGPWPEADDRRGDLR